ncbi:MAG TPA: phosphoenolpyruvate carboxykinase domain-containing protein, partial [Tepidisphaeraceae bacterium]|nr:phosphoenolpyruvate carboxykinase domain-containing protein [Tepidisphaeraceae bacterium]
MTLKLVNEDEFDIRQDHGEVLIPPPQVRQWVSHMTVLCRPEQVYWCDGSLEERELLLEKAVNQGVLIRLNQEKLPGCYLHRSHQDDVGPSEACTFICSPDAELAGPTNNWMESQAAYIRLRRLFHGCMKGRTMYVVPFVMGPTGSQLARVGVQLTDSLYVALSMGVMTRMGDVAWKQLDADRDFTRCLHSVGDSDPKRRYVCHFPLDNTVWSFGSEYGGNALLGKKCVALRMAGYVGRQEGWMAEHMLITGVTQPDGTKTYVAGAFPSACGKTNFAMLVPSRLYREGGWKVSTVGDDIAWLWVDRASGKLRAINPEFGYFGVVPGTNYQTNPNAMLTMSR